MQVNKIVDGAGKAAGCPTQSWETLAREEGGKMRNEEDEGGGMRLKVVKLWNINLTEDRCYFGSTEPATWMDFVAGGPYLYMLFQSVLLPWQLVCFGNHMVYGADHAMVYSPWGALETGFFSVTVQK